MTSPSVCQGYNKVLGRLHNTALEGEVHQRPAGGFESGCVVSVSTEELAQSLQLDPSLSLGLPGPLQLFAAKASLLQSAKTTNHSVSVTIFARKVSRSSQCSNVKPKAGMGLPTDNSSLDQFVETYGDSYISMLEEGGEYYCILTLYSQTKEEQKNLKSRLGVGGLLGPVSVGMDLQQNLTSVLSTVDLNFSLKQQVFGISNPELPQQNDLEGMFSYANRFGALTMDAPAVLRMESTGYESIENLGDEHIQKFQRLFRTVADSRDRLAGTGRGGESGEGLASKMAVIQSMLNQMQWINNTYDFYGGFHDQTLIDHMQTARKDRQAIRSQIDAYDRQATAELEDLSLPSLSNGTPKLNYRIGKSERFGGTGGTPFTFQDIPTYIRTHTRIAGIKLRWGNKYVDQISITYECDQHGIRVEQPEESHGGSQGRGEISHRLLQGQFITKVFGDCGGMVDQLTIVIDDSISLAALGKPGRSSFSFPVPDGHVVLGFSGSSGASLDSLFVHTLSFLPAEWQREVF